MATVTGAAAGAALGSAADGPVGAAGGALAGALVGGLVDQAARRQTEAVWREAYDAGRRDERRRLAEDWWEARTGAGPVVRVRLSGPAPDGSIGRPAEEIGGVRFAARRRPVGDPANWREPVRGDVGEGVGR